MLVTPATGAYGYAMANNYNGVPRPPVIFCRDGDARVVVRRETYEDLTARDDVSGGARSALPRSRHRRRRLRRPARRSARSRSRRSAAGARSSPGCCVAPRATSTRSSPALEIVVELIGGTDPARDYVLRALAAGKHVITANKQLVAQHGDELFEAAREAAACSCASRRRSPASCR